MIDNVKKNFINGITRFKWIAGYLAERVKSETSLAKLQFQSNKLKTRMTDLYSDLGKRIIDLEEKGDKDLLKDHIVRDSIDEIKTLRKELDSFKRRAEKAKR